jgi:uncharacterized membrane protein
MSTPNQPDQPGAHPDQPSESKPAEAHRYEVLMAAYLFVAPGRKDYGAIMKLVKDKAITVEGAVLVSKDHAGEMHIEEGGVGLVVGLLEPRWLAKTALGKDVGTLATKFGKHRADSGIQKKLNETLGAGDAVLMAIYDYDDAGAVRKAVTNSPKTSFAEIDGKSVKDLKAGMAAAQAGMKS